MKLGNALSVGKDVFGRMRKLGLRGTVQTILNNNIVRVGRHIGTDEMGNNYYESTSSVNERKRYVEPAVYYFDASMVPPQWHRWLHYQTDEVPSEKDTAYVYAVAHRPNLTGTSLAYKPPGYQFQKHAKPFDMSQGQVDPVTADVLNAELRSKKD